MRVLIIEDDPAIAANLYDFLEARGEHIFSVVMTTSNHKPFTFPGGVPGVPSRGADAKQACATPTTPLAA